jgi:hypothetical protein
MAPPGQAGWQSFKYLFVRERPISPLLDLPAVRRFGHSKNYAASITELLSTMSVK